MVKNIPVDWEAIIYRGVESEELDYKAAQNWTRLNRVGKAKFARHCMAMANTKGGYIVVGVGEDRAGRPSVDTGLTLAQAKSFDPTTVGNFINRFADPPVEFDIERPVINGKRFAVIVIKRFSLLPHVCCHNCQGELHQGIFYVRTVDAASRPAYRSSEIHSLIQRALRNQRELLGRMLRGILYEGRNNSFEPEAQEQFQDQRYNSSRFFAKKKPEFDLTNSVLCEIVTSPSIFELKKFSLSEIKRAVEKSAYTFVDQPFTVIGKVNESYFSNVAFRSLPAGKNQFWQAFQSGLFHYYTCFDKDSKNNNIKYQEIVKMVSEAIYFMGQYYSELGYDDELLHINFTLSKVEDVSLEIADRSQKGKKKTPEQYTCQIPEIQVSIQRSAADLTSGTVGHAAKIIREICERFNISDFKHQNLEISIRDLLQIQTRTFSA